MTNSSPHGTSDTGEWILGSLTALLLIAGTIVLWRVHVATNALVLTGFALGWPVTAWLAWTDLQRRRREIDHQDHIDERQQTQRGQATMLRTALLGPDDRYIGDAERDAVCTALAEAHERGRIPLDEHEQRSAAALHARHPGDLRATLEGLL